MVGGGWDELRGLGKRGMGMGMGEGGFADLVMRQVLLACTVRPTGPLGRAGRACDTQARKPHLAVFDR